MFSVTSDKVLFTAAAVSSQNKHKKLVAAGHEAN